MAAAEAGRLAATRRQVGRGRGRFGQDRCRPCGHIFRHRYSPQLGALLVSHGQRLLRSFGHVGRRRLQRLWRMVASVAWQRAHVRHAH
eukprot:6168804-Prymnesium_polylepis.2